MHVEHTCAPCCQFGEGLCREWPLTHALDADRPETILRVGRIGIEERTSAARTPAAYCTDTV